MIVLFFFIIPTVFFLIIPYTVIHTGLTWLDGRFIVQCAVDGASA